MKKQSRGLRVGDYVTVISREDLKGQISRIYPVNERKYTNIELKFESGETVEVSEADVTNFLESIVIAHHRGNSDFSNWKFSKLICQ